MSGKVFHAPFLELHPGFELLGSWNALKINTTGLPSSYNYPTLQAILESDADLVVVNTSRYSF
jgi:hypothetical protein